MIKKEEVKQRRGITGNSHNGSNRVDAILILTNFVDFLP